ncbi:MAG: four helix bundle protein [Planctomycetota bacterium]|nr:MAG: four helix bundle protein [Planctomycetota bacterium]
MGEKKAGKIKSFKDLKIWNKGIKLIEDVYKVSKSFPKEETYGLRSQLRRSAVSIPSNIAEGFARFRNKEYRKFLYISLGSCAELTTQIIIASRLKYIEKTKADTILSGIDEISKMTTNLIKKLTTND